MTSSGLLRGIPLAGAVSGAVDSPRGGRSGSARVELWVVTWEEKTRSAINALKNRDISYRVDIPIEKRNCCRRKRWPGLKWCSREGKFTQKLIEVLFAKGSN